MDSKDKLVTLEDLKVVHDEVARYTTCSTAAGTAAKTAALTNFVLTTGSAVKVKFTNTNTASNPTLNVNSTGAKPIMQYGTTVAGNRTVTSWEDGEIVEFLYDGTNWVIVGKGDEGETVLINTGYTAVLDVINDLKNVKTYPITVRKTGSTSYTDLPEGLATDAAFTAIVVGDNAQANVFLCGYWQPSSVWIRSINYGAWAGTWKQSGSVFKEDVNINTYNSDTTTGNSYLYLGNGTASGTAGNSRGAVRLWGDGTYFTTLNAPNSTNWRTISLPDESGTIALQNAVIEGTSFPNMTSIPPYPRNVMETIRTDIASYSNGIYNVASSGGPMYFAHIGKYNNNYWAAMLQTYTDSNIYFVHYANGACKVRIISQ